MASVPNRIIFAIVALGVFGVLVGLMGTSFTDIDTENYQVINLPDDLTSAEYLLSTVDRYANDTITHGGGLVTLDYSGNNTDKVTAIWQSYDKTTIYINRVWTGFWILNNIEPVNPYPLPVSEIDKNFSTETNNTVLYLETAHKAYTFEFNYNTTAYSNISHAIDGGELYMWVGEGEDLDPNSKGVWTLLTSIIFFNNPDIHPVVNFLFAIPFYALFVTIVFYVFSRFIEVIKPLG